MGMQTVTSKDGTSIAFELTGQGPALVLVGGAFMTRQAFAPLAAALASEFSVVSYDRRGRGDSTITEPYAVDRELVALAPTLVHDNAIMAGYRLPSWLAQIAVPALVLSSTGSFEWLQASAAATAVAIPAGRHLSRDGGFHDLPPATLAAALTEFFKG